MSQTEHAESGRCAKWPPVKSWSAAQDLYAKHKKDKPIFPWQFSACTNNNNGLLFLKHIVVADKSFPELIASVCKNKTPQYPTLRCSHAQHKTFTTPDKVHSLDCSEQWPLAVSRQEPQCLTELLPHLPAPQSLPWRWAESVSWAETSNTSKPTTGICLARAENDAYT